MPKMSNKEVCDRLERLCSCEQMQPERDAIKQAAETIRGLLDVGGSETQKSRPLPGASRNRGRI